MGRGDEITSIARLKKAIEKLNRAEYMSGHENPYTRVLDLIGEFEASVRERLAEVENKTPKHVGGHFHPASELRRILEGR